MATPVLEGRTENYEKQNKKSKSIKLLQVQDADDSQDSFELERPASPLRMSREDVLSFLGYRSEHVPKPVSAASSNQRSDLCHRCGKKVYPLEKVDVGELYHRGCLRCFVCGLQLSLKTFQRVVSDAAAKEVYCKSHIPKVGKSINQDSIGIRSAVAAQKKASEKVFKPYEQTAYNYDPAALEFQHARELKQRQKVQRRSSLKTHDDFEKYGVFEAQADLEKRHRQEEDELYHQIFEERQRLMRNLEEVLLKEKEHTVKELVSWFEQQGSSKLERDDGLKKVEQYYQEKREAQIKELLDLIAADERAAVDRMIEKHSQEMLFLIEEKEREVEESLEAREEGKIGRDAYKYLSVAHISKKQFPQKTGEEIREEEEEEYYKEEKELEEEEEEGELEQGEEEWEDVDEEWEDEEPEEDIKNRRDYQNDFDKEYRELDAEEREEQEEHEEEAPSHAGQEQSEEEDLNEDSQMDVTVAFETPKALEIQKCEIVSKERLKKPTTESKMTQHTLQEMTDVETQTYAPVPKRRTSIQALSESDDSFKMKGSSKHLSGKPKTAPSASPQFQITVSTERLPDKEVRKQVEPRHLRKIDTPKKVMPLKAEGSTTRARNKNYDEDDDDQSVQISELPEVRPPLCRKAKLYNSPEVFRELDQRAVEEAKKDPISFTDLVRRLSQKCQTDLQKVRAIFRWISAKDLNKMKFTENEGSDSPMGLLKGIKYGTESYHNLFKRLCSYAGLHCKIIDGFSKGAGYRPGSKFKGQRFRNQWTAVWIEDSWRFINCNWGARHVKRAGDEQMTYKIDEFYFLTDPEDHIFQHFPDDAKWQLLRKPISIEDFVHLPVVKSPFFNNRLGFVTKTGSVLQTTDGCRELRLNTQNLMGFAVKVKSKDRAVRSEVLKDCCLIRIINNQAVFLVDLPSPGQFYWEIFVDSEWLSETMDSACSFLLHCSSPSSSHSHSSYPQVGCFGRTPLCELYDIHEMTHVDPLIMSTGELSISVKVPKRTLRLSHSFRFWNQRDKMLVDCDRYAFLRSRLDSTTTFNINCPSKGRYVLSLLVIDPSKTSSKPVPFYRYLIDCQTPAANAHLLPHSSSKWFDCKLIEPLQGQLLNNTKVQFRVESKLATEVVVSVCGTWMELKNTDGIWQGIIATGNKAGKLCLYGRFESSKDKYIPLWEFNINEATVMDEVRNLLKYL